MPKWGPGVLLVLFILPLVQICNAQDADPSDPLPQATAVAPDTGSDAGAPADQPIQPMLSSPSSTRPSEWQIMSSQWKRILPDMAYEQKGMWLFPVSAARGHHWKPTLAVLGATALLTAVDAHDAKWVRNNLQPLNGFNNAFAGYNTATATEAFASAFYLAAIARRNSYDQETFILAGEAVLNSEILTTIMKDADGREAPVSYPEGGSFTNSWFKVRSGGWLGGLGSMPSGHEIAVMSVATIFAERYPHPAWHRWVAYGLAAAVGFSRVSLQSHFTSDTFAGAALGYAIARYLVLPHAVN